MFFRYIEESDREFLLFLVNVEDLLEKEKYCGDKTDMYIVLGEDKGEYKFVV